MEIKVTNLKKAFGEKVAVNIPEFTINNGDILGLVGNNGAGKTTLFRMILDLLQADEGKVEYTIEQTTELGSQTAVINPAESEEWKQHVGAYVDDGFLIDFLTPEEYFDFVGKVSGLKKEEIAERLATYEKFMAGEILGQKKLIRDYSAGNKQKIGIISALLTQPKIVILDEPFNFLDPSSQNVLKKLIVNYAQEHNATIIISSHNLQHTVEVSTRIALLEHGVIINDLVNTDQCAEAELESYFSIE
ncbi:MAG: ABC transporter ATP-binding protein [Prevotellaceae bacterium]|nr:ABC transporter ATP-binding protein [Prevotellaceae bacterium]